MVHYQSGYVIILLGLFICLISIAHRVKDEKLTKEIYDVALDPTSMKNVLSKKLQPYNEIESSLNDPRNRLIVGFMKVAVEIQMLITQIKRDMDEQVVQIIKRMEKLEEAVEASGQK